jgi:hypothetical protein
MIRAATRRVDHRTLRLVALNPGIPSRPSLLACYRFTQARGKSSIWTLEVQSAEGRRKVLTVEVNNAANLVCQARAKGNALPGDKHRGRLQCRAEQAGLRVMPGI